MVLSFDSGLFLMIREDGDGAVADDNGDVR